MPELPDLTVYLEAIERHAVGHTLERVLVVGPNVLRTVDPPLSALHGRALVGVSRMGKRLVFRFTDEHVAVLHLMVAGRLRWKPPRTMPPRKVGLASFQFEHGTLVLTEASSKKRASLHVVRGADALAALESGGIEPLEADLDAFADALRRENHTLKRSLTDPRLFAGIGNAYSDEILHAAGLSPAQLTHNLDDEEIARLQTATRDVLTTWTERLRAEIGEGFPEKVTAFRDGMAVHGRFGEPCPVCGDPVQRIVRAENEVNYCATCQTNGKLLKDRALSQLLGKDWPRSLEEMEERLGER